MSHKLKILWFKNTLNEPKTQNFSTTGLQEGMKGTQDLSIRQLRNSLHQTGCLWNFCLGACKNWVSRRLVNRTIIYG